MTAIDADDALPLYHQIAEVIRGRIASGQLRIGDSLEPMRRAAASFGVNLHTVRHAYLALSRDGLVEMHGARGTHVISDAVPIAPARHGERSLTEFLRYVVEEAATRYHLSTEELVTHLVTERSPIPDRTPSIAIVECSDWQCQRHVEELEQAWRIDARPHPLTNASPPEAEFILATWFHYNDVRLRWPDLLNRVDFLTIRPDLSPFLGLAAQKWWVVERDEATAGAVAGDVRAALGGDSREILQIVTVDPVATVGEITGMDPILFPPRVWADLDESARSHEQAFELRYVFDTNELSSIANRHVWPRRADKPSPRSYRA